MTEMSGNYFLIILYRERKYVKILNEIRSNYIYRYINQYIYYLVSNTGALKIMMGLQAIQLFQSIG